MARASSFLRLAAIFAALVIVGQVPAEHPPPAPPDPALIEFVGELGGEDAEFLLYSTSRDAKRAAKDAVTDTEAAPPPKDEVEAALAWDSLDEPVRAVLAGEAERWTALPPERQRALADGAGRWIALDGIGRAQANERWQTWRSLTPEQRERVQKAWAGFRELTPVQQQAVRTAYLRFQDLPQDQRDGLLERLQRMSPEERRRAMNRRQGPKPGMEDKRPCPPC